METIHLNYDEPPKLYHLKVAKLAAEYTPSGRVLDIGSGAGHVLREINRLRPDLELYAADINPHGFSNIESVVNEAFVLSEGTFDLTPVGSGYDAVVLCHVLEHLSEPVKALDSIFSVLKPGGVLVLAVPNPVNPANFLKVALRKYQANQGHVVAWDRGHWLNFLSNIIHEKIICIDHDEVFLFPRKTPVKSALKKMEILLAKVLPGWSFSNIAVIKRS